MAWQAIETAPKDGRLIWGWLSDSGIRALFWQTAEDCAAAEGLPADMFEAGWAEYSDPTERWEPKFWMPYEAIPCPGEGEAPDVARLVIAARIVAFEDQGAEAMKELELASEVFAARVPWDDEPQE